jgi:hypothetical protein
MVLVHMQAMKKTMDGWCKDDSDIGYKNHPAEQGVKGGKPFSTDCFYVNHRAHSAQDHRCVVKGVKPWDTGCNMVSDNTYHKTDGNDHYPDQKILAHSPVIDLFWSQRLRFVFVHIAQLIDKNNKFCVVGSFVD